jgi:DNA-directed RNA polymerase subunit RPC12/RpoP
MTYHVICAWCGKKIGIKPAEEPESTEDAITHAICPECKQKALAEIDSQLKEGEES